MEEGWRNVKKRDKISMLIIEAYILIFNCILPVGRVAFVLLVVKYENSLLATIFINWLL